LSPGRAGRLRALTRIAALAVACVVFALVAVQFARIVERNLSYARAVEDVTRDIASLERKRAEQRREIQRLSDPEGAIPEIHDRLHLVGDHEAIIYLNRHD
jgi:hypothetical protein